MTSVGIGHKVTGGRRGKQVALQFTVVRKAEPEALEALHTAPIPETVMVDGVEVPTDVIERSYKPQFRRVAEVESPPRKTRLDPIQPGASVGAVTVSAGTIGCIVFDKADGTPYVLSNWHVLHGARGALGEEVEHLPHQIGTRRGEIVLQQLGERDTVRSGHRTASFGDLEAFSRRLSR
ncbi:hypothetical protein [Streptomyces sp. NPDC002845]